MKMEKWDKEKAIDETVINENNLQYEWNVQPVMFLENSLRVSELIHKRDSLKSVRAREITADYKRTMGKFISDAGLGRALESDQAIIDLNFEISNARASVNALSQKKTSLENLTTLLINGLNAEPKTPEEKKAIREHIQESVKGKNGKNKK
jgi:hypothetical protein